MTQRSFFAGVILVAVLAGTCGAAHKRAMGSARATQRKVAIFVNGQRLASQPGPLVVSGRLLVPIVRVFGALGIPVTHSGKHLIARAPQETIRIVLGSRRVLVDRRTIVLDVAPVQINDTTYVPLGLLSHTLSAAVAYDGRAGSVRISTSLVGRALSTQRTSAGNVRISGNLTAIDSLSQPHSITVTFGNSVRTISIDTSARIVLEDVVARSQERATLEDLRVGDAVAVTMGRNGGVTLIEDRFGSREGRIAAVSTSALVLDDGRVLTPDRTTAIVLDGALANLGDLRVGDTVTERMNPETGETRDIIAVRAMPAAAATSLPSGAHAPAIAGFSAEPLEPQRLGQRFTFTLDGTPGGRATYDVGSFLLGQPMREEQPGVYRATLPVSAGMNFTQASVTGRLAVDGNIATRQATNKISAATVAPQITDIAPVNGQVVNNNMPSIYATFDAPTDLGVDPQSVVLKVDGKDVTSFVTRTSSFVTYTCNAPLADGPVVVSVAVADLAGNEATRTWTFTIQTR